MEENRKGGFASAGAGGSFIFTMFCMMVWLVFTGRVGPTGGLTFSILQSITGLGFVIASLITLARNDGSGVVGFIFSMFFGLFAGISGVANVFLTSIGLPLDNTVMGVCWLLCGLFLCAILPGFIVFPWYVFICYVTGGVGLVLMGLALLGILPGVGVAITTGWVFFVCGLCGFYMVIQEVNAIFGIHLPIGPAFVKPKAK